MIHIIFYILFFIERSSTLDFPYSFFAIPYLTYITYRYGNEGITGVFAVAIIYSFTGMNFSEILIYLLLYYALVYFFSTFVLYEKINIIFITGIELLLYLPFLYLRLGKIEPFNIMVTSIGYLILNFYFIRKDDVYAGGL